MNLRTVAFACSAALFAGCAGGTTALPPSSTPAAPAHSRRATVVIRIRIPHKRHRRHERYVSSSTQGMTIAISGPTNVNESLGLTPSSPGCTTAPAGTSCTATVAIPPCKTSTCYTATITTYDAVSCTASSCKIPITAKALSYGQSAAFSVISGQSNSLNLTLDGVPASVAVVPTSPTQLTGTSSSGFAITKCVTAPQNVTVLAVDADGNYIFGAGAPLPALSSDDTVHLAVATPSPWSPNTFALVPPASLVSGTIPNSNGIVHLTATVAPPAGSGIPGQNAQVKVTFNTDVCGLITEYSVPTSGSEPHEITTGPDGALWFTELIGGKIGRIATSGAITETSVASGTDPTGISAGPDGALWFTEEGGSSIGRITTGGTVTTTLITGHVSHPWGITAGPDGALWFAECAFRIGRINTGGTITGETTIPTVSGVPHGIASGPDGALWFTESCANNIGRITAGGTVTGETPIPTSSSAPEGITAGPDGALWFTERLGDKIGRITTGGTITETGIPTSGSRPYSIAVGPDGALWFTESCGNKIGRITTNGTISEMTIPTNSSVPIGITKGPDGALWFTEELGNKIGRVQ